MSRLYDTRMELMELKEELEGSEAKNQIGERNPTSPTSRMYVGYRALSTTYGPTQMHKETVVVGQSELSDLQGRVNEIAETVIPELEREVQAAGAPPSTAVETDALTLRRRWQTPSLAR